MQLQFSYAIVRSKRKTIAIHVHKNNQVEVRSPLFLSQKEIESFVYKKSDWILKTIEKNNLQLPFVKKEFITGENFFFAGKAYTLQTVFSNSAIKKTKIEKNQIFLPVKKNNAQEIKNRLETFYKYKTQQLLEERLEDLSLPLGKKLPQKINIRKYKRRWGSCNDRLEISFNIFLSMLPLSVFDYVVVHELSHLYHFNHSRSFWEKVQQGDKNYREHRRFLKEQGHLFALE